MTSQDLNFRIPGLEHIFCLEELAFYDRLFEQAIHETNHRLERGVIEVYQGGMHTPHVLLAKMPVRDAILKFGIVERRR